MMPIKKGVCAVCNGTDRCSVCKGKGEVSRDSEKTKCKLCGGSGRCIHCIRKNDCGGWICY